MRPVEEVFYGLLRKPRLLQFDVLCYLEERMGSIMQLRNSFQQKWHLISTFVCIVRTVSFMDINVSSNPFNSGAHYRTALKKDDLLAGMVVNATARRTSLG